MIGDSGPVHAVPDANQAQVPDPAFIKDWEEFQQWRAAKAQAEKEAEESARFDSAKDRSLSKAHEASARAFGRSLRNLGIAATGCVLGIAAAVAVDRFIEVSDRQFNRELNKMSKENKRGGNKK